MHLRLKFNEDAQNYDKYRPTYPDELFLDIIHYSGISSGNNALEIGIGTGQSTEPILNNGCNVKAIELGDNLAQYVKNKFRYYDNFSVVNEDFIKCSIDEESFDLVYCATAFHWLPQEEAFTKVKSILKSNGTVALFWNHPFPNRQDDISNIVSRKIYNKYRPSDKEIIEFNQNNCEKYINELYQYGFKDITCKLYHRKRTLTSEQYICLLNTYSDHRALPIELKNSFERDMKASIDEIGGMINIYDTIDLYLARKI